MGKKKTNRKNCGDDSLEFEIREAKKRYDDFPYWKKEHFKSVRRSVFGE